MSLFESVPLRERNTEHRRTTEVKDLQSMNCLDTDLQLVESSLRQLPLAAPSDRLRERMQRLFEQYPSDYKPHDGQAVVQIVSEAGNRVGFGRADRPDKHARFKRGINRLVMTAVICLSLGFIVGLSSGRHGLLGRPEAPGKNHDFASSTDVRPVVSGTDLNESVGFGGQKTFSVSLKGSDSAAVDSLLLALADSKGQPGQTDQAGKTPWQRTRWWEQQSGISFSVATHVSDARFDFCRLCHLAASNMATDGTVR